MNTSNPIQGVLGATSRIVDKIPQAGSARSVRIAPGLEVMEQGVLLSVPGVARYLIHSGSIIDVEVAAGADPSAVELFLRGSARAFLIHQRGELPIEASTIIDRDGTCLALCGFAGVGKSTLAAALVDRGGRLVADGLTRVTLLGGRPVVWPSDSALGLWQDTCERLGMETAKLVRVRADLQKFAVPVPAEPNSTTLNVVVRMRMGPAAGVVEVPRQGRAEVISEAIFRRLLLDAMDAPDDRDRIVRRMAETCRVLVLNGARECREQEMADCLSEALQ